MSGHHHHGHGTSEAVTATLAVNLAILAAKWTAFAFTGSPSLFGEAAHSTADTLNPLVLWIGHRRSGRPPDRRHPYGHGREAFFWSMLAAGMMLVIGSAVTAYHGIETLLSGDVPRRSAAAMAIMACAVIGETWSLGVVWRRLKRERKDRAIADSKNPILLALLVENGADVLGVLLAASGYGMFVLTGSAAWDACFSLAIAALLAVSSIFLINRSRSLIIGESAPAESAERIAEAVRQRPSVAEVRALTAVMRSPHEIACRIAVRWDVGWYAERCREAGSLSAGDVLAIEAAEIRAIGSAIRAAVPEVTEIGIDVAS